MKWRPKAGHTVLQLPPYHCDLKPIEFAWAYIKNDVALHNVSYKIKEIEQLLNVNINKTQGENWKQFVEHVKKLEDKL